MLVFLVVEGGCDFVIYVLDVGCGIDVMVVGVCVCSGCLGLCGVGERLVYLGGVFDIVLLFDGGIEVMLCVLL